jgi:hypothetical protein
MIKVGDRVRVQEGVKIYHHPNYRNQPFELMGKEGEVVAILEAWKGKPISPNFPVLVKFTPKLKAHFKADELKIL